MQRTKNTTMAAGIAGAVIGAGVTAAVTALSDKKTRETVISRLESVKKRAVDMMESGKEKIEEVQTETEKISESADKNIYKMKDDIEPAAKTV
jgi:hypothetical protein